MLVDEKIEGGNEWIGTWDTFFPIRDYIVIVASTATYVVVTLESIERPLNAKHLGDHRDTRQQVL